MGKVPPNPSRLRVLIVDDYGDARDSLSLLVDMWGYSCITAADGPAALQAAADFLPDVVLMDIGLPRMDGYKVTRELRKLSGMERAVFVAVTGYSRVPDPAGVMGDDFFAYLVKPVEPEELLELLNLLSLKADAWPTNTSPAAINLCHSPG